MFEEGSVALGIARTYESGASVACSCVTILLAAIFLTLWLTSVSVITVQHAALLRQLYNRLVDLPSSGL
jgi:hypothetical protein